MRSPTDGLAGTDQSTASPSYPFAARTREIPTEASPVTDDLFSPSDRRCWRDLIRVHPAAYLFPMMSDEELDALAEDIVRNGLRQGVVLWTPEQPSPEPAKDVSLIDGRNRLEAIERGIADPKQRDEAIRFALRVDVGGQSPDEKGRAILLYGDTDPYDFVISANLHRRNLTREQKREVVERLLTANPERSDRAIARIAKVHHETVGTVRVGLESTGGIRQLNKTVGADGKARPARRSTEQRAPKPKAAAKQLRDVAISDFSKLLHQHPADALNDLTQLLCGEQARLAEIPLPRRVVFACAYMQALGVGLNDLSPGGASAQ